MGGSVSCSRKFVTTTRSRSGDGSSGYGSTLASHRSDAVVRTTARRRTRAYFCTQKIDAVFEHPVEYPRNVKLEKSML